MIIDLALIFLNCLTIGAFILAQYNNAKERKDLIRAVISKNMTEINTAEAIDKMPKAEETKPPDLIPVQEADDDLFAKMIKEQNKLTPK